MISTSSYSCRSQIARAMMPFSRPSLRYPDPEHLARSPAQLPNVVALPWCQPSVRSTLSFVSAQCDGKIPTRPMYRTSTSLASLLLPHIHLRCSCPHSRRLLGLYPAPIPPPLYSTLSLPSLALAQDSPSTQSQSSNASTPEWPRYPLPPSA